jgi:hypothetical protein
MTASLGLPDAAAPEALVGAFDPASLPRTPAVYGA